MPRWRGPPLAEAEHQCAGASVPGVGVGAQENGRREGQPGETQEDGVSEFDDPASLVTVFTEGKLGSVEHHGCITSIDATSDEFIASTVIQVQGGGFVH
jgi:hypothetical protein